MIGRTRDIQRVRIVSMSRFEKVLRIHAICLRQSEMTLSIWGDQVRLFEMSTPRSLIWGLHVIEWPWGSWYVGVSLMLWPKWMCSNLSPLKTALFRGAHGYMTSLSSSWKLWASLWESTMADTRESSANREAKAF